MEKGPRKVCPSQPKDGGLTVDLSGRAYITPGKRQKEKPEPPPSPSGFDRAEQRPACHPTIADVHWCCGQCGPAGADLPSPPGRKRGCFDSPTGSAAAGSKGGEPPVPVGDARLNEATQSRARWHSCPSTPSVCRAQWEPEPLSHPAATRCNEVVSGGLVNTPFPVDLSLVAAGPSGELILQPHLETMRCTGQEANSEAKGWS